LCPATHFWNIASETGLCNRSAAAYRIPLYISDADLKSFIKLSDTPYEVRDETAKNNTLEELIIRTFEKMGDPAKKSL